jgi:hypothetical protein
MVIVETGSFPFEGARASTIQGLCFDTAVHARLCLDCKGFFHSLVLVERGSEPQSCGLAKSASFSPCEVEEIPAYPLIGIVGARATIMVEDSCVMQVCAMDVFGVRAAAVSLPLFPFVGLE